MTHPSEQVERYLVVHPDAATRQTIEQALRQARQDRSIAVHEAATPAEALRAAAWLDPAVVLLDLTEEPELALEVVRELRRADRLTIGLYNPLILRNGERGLFRQATRAGCGDFVPVPVSNAELSAALEALPEVAGQDRSVGRTVTFISPKGGVGTTTLAVNTALVLAGSGEAGEVALCDAALQFGTATAFLGLAPDRDLADLARDLDHLSGLATYLTRQPETGLKVLGSPRDPFDAEGISPATMSRVLIELRRRFDLVVVDAPPVLDLLSLAVLDLSETIFVVTEGLAPTISATARFLHLLDTQGFGAERVRVVLNRHGALDGGPSTVTVGERLGRPVSEVIPFDRGGAAAAHRGRPPVLTQKNPFSEAIGRLAEACVATPGTPGS